jgi:hypothetical protein
MHFSGTDGAVFDAYRELIEEVASEAHDAVLEIDDYPSSRFSRDDFGRQSRHLVKSRT